MNGFKKYAASAVFVTGLLSLSGCKDFLEVNIDPTRTIANPPNLILPSVQAQLGFNTGGEVGRFTLLFSQQLAAQAGRQTEAWDAYVLQPTEVNGLWRNAYYAGILADIEEILKAQNVSPVYYGVAKALKAYTYSVTTDLWGDVPFTEALQGTENPQPKPDASKDIYPRLIALLDEAITDLRKTSPLTAPTSTDDYIYGGNATRWVKFANTLKLRLYLHMANAPGFDDAPVRAFLTNTPPADFMAAVADDFQMRFDIIARRQNPTHQFFLDRQDDITSGASLVDLMNRKRDPRRAAYFTPAPFSPALLAAPPITDSLGYRGLRNGTAGGSINNTFSRLHTYVRGAVTSTTIPPGPTLLVSGLTYAGNAPVQMLTFAEYNFIRAEMALRYGIPGNAEEFYRAGIAASHTDAGVPAAQATAYLATAAGTLGTGDAALRKLIEEKYVANFMVPLEPWNDWRRTGFPALVTIPVAVSPGNGGRVPRALPYPQQEVDANPNLKQRTTLSERPVYWDVRTKGPQ
ncbi:MAG: SusD/RagB family nutrient-binding outer membrane lipoprotein [Cytophagaceae bacterium]|nr:SusD/RagB family nutrient-binding outer membrane lipoprotein [Cytophagaceae bacterium]